MPSDNNLTISARLKRLGYGHERSRISGKRRVYRLSDGATVGTLDAAEAVVFLTANEGRH
jgi:hypothetical protein